MKNTKLGKEEKGGEGKGIGRYTGGVPVIDSEGGGGGKKKKKNGRPGRGSLKPQRRRKETQHTVPIVKVPEQGWENRNTHHPAN